MARDTGEGRVGIGWALFEEQVAEALPVYPVSRSHEHSSGQPTTDWTQRQEEVGQRQSASSTVEKMLIQQMLLHVMMTTP